MPKVESLQTRMTQKSMSKSTKASLIQGGSYYIQEDAIENAESFTIMVLTPLGISMFAL